jgi:hypothetical protein
MLAILNELVQFRENGGTVAAPDAGTIKNTNRVSTDRLETFNTAVMQMVKDRNRTPAFDENHVLFSHFNDIIKRSPGELPSDKDVPSDRHRQPIWQKPSVL